jgi:hypothetical protein
MHCGPMLLRMRLMLRRHPQWGMGQRGGIRCLATQCLRWLLQQV